MAQQVRVFASKPEDLNSVPGTHVERRELASASCPVTST